MPKFSSYMSAAGLGLVALFILSACSKNPKLAALPIEQQELIEKGRTVYFANCVQCHNANPKKSGATGPDLYASTKELVHKRVIFLEYPEGYKPKRNTSDMGELEELEADIPALHAFINSPEH